jgi:hypothetical protein
MGGKIPREIKEKVIHEWLQGTRRETIAQKNDLAVGSITSQRRQLTRRVS